MGILKKIFRPLFPFFFRLFLYKQKICRRKKFLILWNRGLGDIPLGLYGLNQRIREIIPDAKITYLTRSDLTFGFSLLEGCSILEDVTLQRGKNYSISKDVTKNYDVILLKPNPTDWLKDQLKKITPKLNLKKEVEKKDFLTIGLHVQTETDQYYGYEKNWPKKSFQELIAKLNERNIKPYLFGLKKDQDFEHLQVNDVRGEKNLTEVLQIILQECDILIAPDSGILSIVYYLDCQFDLNIISIWSDPFQGILKQGVDSPNKKLKHQALISKNLSELSTDTVFKAIESIRI